MLVNELNGLGGLNLTSSPYLRRLRERRQVSRMKQLVVFGHVLGWFIILFSGFQYFFVITKNDHLWEILIVLGIVLMLLAIVIPSSLSWLEKALRLPTQYIGEIILKIILIMIYFFVVMPVGLMLALHRGTKPFYAWNDKCDIPFQGWLEKQVPKELEDRKLRNKKRPLLLQPILVLGYFLHNGNYIFIPAITLMISLGLVMFFLKTSSLAPLIYTLF